MDSQARSETRVRVKGELARVTLTRPCDAGRLHLTLTVHVTQNNWCGRGGLYSAVYCIGCITEREREKSRNAHGALLATVTAQHTKVATVSGQGTLIDHVKRTWTDPHVHALGAAGHAWEFFGMKRNAPSGVERP